MSSKRSSSDAASPHAEYVNGDEKRRPSYLDIQAKNLNAVFENPLADIPKETLLQEVDEFCERFNLMEFVQEFRKGALVSQSPHRIQEIEELTSADIDALRREHTHKWSQPWKLYWLVSKFGWRCRIRRCHPVADSQCYSHVFSRRCGSRNGRNGKQRSSDLLSLRRRTLSLSVSHAARLTAPTRSST